MGDEKIELLKPKGPAKWNKRSAFILAAIGSAVGLGNVWRFPFVCYENGGGAFLIPYLVAIITAGIPLMILEFSLGHKMASGAPISFGKAHKKSEWVGWVMVIVGFIITVYYAVIMSWCFNYVFQAVNSLGWGDSPGEFFNQTLLQITDGPGSIGGLSWPLVIGLVLTWGAIYFAIRKGARSVGKVVLLTVPLPWLLLVVMSIRGATLEGSAAGLNYFLNPDWSALLDPSVWLSAYGQVFFSFSLAFGVMITYASYLPRKADINNNAVIISLSDAATSFLAGLTVFATLGFLAQSGHQSVGEVMTAGPGLVFAVYPTIFNQMPFWPGFFAAIFFIMLLLLGIDSAFSLVEAKAEAWITKLGLRRKPTLLVICTIAMLMGLFFATGSGLYWLDIVDNFLNKFGLILGGLFECIVLGWLYGSKKLREYANKQSEIRIGRWWDFLIKYFTPLILIVTFGLDLYRTISEGYGGYPDWAVFVGGWCVVALIFILSFLFSRIRTRKREGADLEGGEADA